MDPEPPYPFPARELSEPRQSKDGTPANTPASELESMPEVQPGLGPLVQLLGRHRTQHHLEVAINATTSAALGDAGRAALARMALAVPGTLVKPITGVRILVPSGAELGDLAWSLRHPHVAICVPGPKAGTLQIHRGPSVRAATDNLTKSLAELAALG